MRRRLRKRDDAAEVNMTPMLDIVFILLIFFIVTATFLRENGLNMSPPPPSDEQPDDPPPTILVSVDANSNIFINSQIVDIDRVTARIQRQMVENRGESAVLIRPHTDSLHGVITRVYDSAELAEPAGIVIQPPEDF